MAAWCEEDTEARRDELLALESIYGDGVARIGKGGVVRQAAPGGDDDDSSEKNAALDAYTVAVAVSLPDEFALQAVWGGGDGQDVEFKIAHLPPMVLHVEPREGYPSRCLPGFRLMCDWLTQEQMEALAEGVRAEVLDDAEGNVIVFSIISFLAAEVLDALAIDSVLVLESQQNFLVSPAGSDAEAEARRAFASEGAGVDESVLEVESLMPSNLDDVIALFLPETN